MNWSVHGIPLDQTLGIVPTDLTWVGEDNRVETCCSVMYSVQAFNAFDGGLFPEGAVLSIRSQLLGRSNWRSLTLRGIISTNFQGCTPSLE